MSVNAESTKAIRQELKVLFLSLKMSVRMKDYCCVYVDILEGNIEFKKHETDRGQTYYANRSDYFSVNEFYIDDHWKGEAKKLFKTILNTIY